MEPRSRYARINETGQPWRARACLPGSRYLRSTHDVAWSNPTPVSTYSFGNLLHWSCPQLGISRFPCNAPSDLCTLPRSFGTPHPPRYHRTGTRILSGSQVNRCAMAKSTCSWRPTVPAYSTSATCTVLRVLAKYLLDLNGSRVVYKT